MVSEPVIILDTHVLVQVMEGDDRLGPKSRKIITGEGAKDEVFVSAITPWEIAMLVEKQRLSLGSDVGDWIEQAINFPGINLAPLVPSIAVDSVRLPGEINNDPADRIIVATARHHDAPLITADMDILAYAAAGNVRAIDARL